MLYDYLYEAVHEASPGPKVAAALEDNMEAAGIVSPKNSDALVGSRLFNVASAAMDSLREQPEIPVTGNLVNVSEPEDWLARFTVRIINDSLTRPHYSKLPQFLSGVLGKLGTCSFAEEAFQETVNEQIEVEDSEVTGKIFVDKEGVPIMIKKYIGDPSTLTLKPIQINRVRYPAGTILALQESLRQKSMKTGKLSVVRFDTRHVAGAAALRFSSFAFRPEDRPRVMQPDTQTEPLVLNNSAFGTATLSSLVGSKPERKRLRLIYNALAPLTKPY